MNIDKVDGILLDLGVSSYQLEEVKRGFSYMKDAPMDMRMDKNSPFSAYDVVNKYSQQELERVIREYGEEKWASRIAKFIVKEREKGEIKTTFQLVEINKKRYSCLCQERRTTSSKKNISSHTNRSQ